ncbi:hypothetical protein APA_3087 [Pseudanabaena sp. lw0831]|uniref:hypothetical protein n=1 Tax=Pseudanabaena sp. lw0831 TaxID=1357935 RepID=UPI001A2E5789|nr:hypothetical protein [Pseudanabaena sp. lw0831]GBO55037.1 hypothetical protein APA_3087 [Pseudanabaena sp. lw0831]
MNWIVAKIKWIMLVSGLLTCTLFYAAIAPQAALRSTFGDSLEGQLAEIIVRNWGALITLVGVMQIYGAFNPPMRRFVLVIACVSKLTFISLVLIYGRQYLAQAGLAIAIDSVMVILFIIYMFSDRQKVTKKI